MKDKRQNLRKAAVLVASLDGQRAEAILAQMSPVQARAIRETLEQLGPLDAAEQSEVIEEFFRIGPLLPDREPSGIELNDPQCARLSLPASEYTGVADAAVPSAETAQPSRGLSDVAPAALASFLESEQPQTVAVVLSRLPAQRAAEVLAALPPETQVEVARRVVDRDEADPEILREVEGGLEAWLGEQDRAHRRRAAGMMALGAILEAASSNTREHILANLTGRDGSLPASAEAAPPAPLTFAELERFDTASLRVLLHRAETELLVLALAGARPEFAGRALGIFPPARAQLLRRALCHLGPTRLSDIEEAQTELANLARQLERDGEIARRAARHLSVAV